MSNRNKPTVVIIKIIPIPPTAATGTIHTKLSLPSNKYNEKINNHRFS